MSDQQYVSNRHHIILALQTKSRFIQTPRFLFQVTKPDDSEFFVAFFSQEKKRLTLVNLPQSVDLTLGARLRSLFERKVSSVEVHDESFRVFEIRRKSNSNG